VWEQQHAEESGGGFIPRPIVEVEDIGLWRERGRFAFLEDPLD